MRANVVSSCEDGGCEGPRRVQAVAWLTKERRCVVVLPSSYSTDVDRSRVVIHVVPVFCFMAWCGSTIHSSCMHLINNGTSISRASEDNVIEYMGSEGGQAFEASYSPGTIN